MLIESASGIAERALEQSGHYTDKMNQAAIRRSIETLNSFGVTSFLEAASMKPIMAALKGLDDSGSLTAWAGCVMPAVEPSFMFGLSGDELLAVREQFRSPHVKPDFVKLFLDGVPGFKTAAFHEPYTADPIRGCCFRGQTLMTVPDLIRWLNKCEKRGLSVKTHCAGDAAVTQALDAIDVVRSFNGPTRLTHQIAHASYITPQDVKRFAALGVVADLSPIIWYPTFFLEGHKVAMGTERAERFWPNRDLKEAGALMSGGSDWPVIPNPDPWNGVEGLITRRNPSGEFGDATLWPSQALDLPTVLEIYTINGARAMGLEGVTGPVEIGKSADLIVLDRNLFRTPPQDLAETKVLTPISKGARFMNAADLEPLRLVTVLTGFLGSGKTTTLARLLKTPEFAGSVAIINEFGEIGLDHLLIESSQERFALLDNGCVCCTVRDDLVETLLRLAARARGGELPPFRRVVIETNGLADPAPILHALIADERLAATDPIDGVVTTVDAANGLATLGAHAEAVKQVAVADRLVVTKTDLVDEATQASLLAQLSALNSTAEVILSRDGDVPAAALVGAALESRTGVEIINWFRRAATPSRFGAESHDALCANPRCLDRSHGLAHGPTSPRSASPSITLSAGPRSSNGWNIWRC